MSYMLNNCYSLSSLPDISKWYISNALNISYMFNNCESLVSLPDIVMWNNNRANHLNLAFKNNKNISLDNWLNNLIKNIYPNLSVKASEFSNLTQNIILSNPNNIFINSNKILQNYISLLSFPQNNNNNNNNNK